MAGHSKFKNIQHRKNAQDNKRGKMFTRLARDIFVAAKSGILDVNANARLRLAITAARTANMPKEKIDNAILKATSPNNTNDYEDIRYEGYGSGGVAIIVEALTDNRNRTASEIRSIFTKFGGELGEPGSVSFMFKKLGLIHYPLAVCSADQMMEETIDAGADDCVTVEHRHEIICAPESLLSVAEILKQKLGEAEESEVIWRAMTTIQLNLEKSIKVMALVDALEANDDVQSVSGNFIVAEELNRDEE
jgi:YebC/PmpR family DNA-binding regulatory protein